jgi:hypothetical protein
VENMASEKKRSPGRPKNPNKRAAVSVQMSGQAYHYLERLRDSGYYGDSVPDVCRTILMEKIREFIDSNELEKLDKNASLLVK